MFLVNNTKYYNVGEHEESVEGKRGKAEFNLYFSSVLHVIPFLFLSRNTSDTVIPFRKLLHFHPSEILLLRGVTSSRDFYSFLL